MNHHEAIKAAYEKTMANPALDRWKVWGAARGFRLATLREIQDGTPDQLFSGKNTPIFVKANKPLED